MPLSCSNSTSRRRAPRKLRFYGSCHQSGRCIELITMREVEVQWRDGDIARPAPRAKSESSAPLHSTEPPPIHKISRPHGSFMRVMRIAEDTPTETRESHTLDLRSAASAGRFTLSSVSRGKRRQRHEMRKQLAQHADLRFEQRVSTQHRAGKGHGDGRDAERKSFHGRGHGAGVEHILTHVRTVIDSADYEVRTLVACSASQRRAARNRSVCRPPAIAAHPVARVAAG